MSNKIDWSKVNHFTPKEFSEDPDKYANPNLIYTLNDFRKLVGKSAYPSPVSGALARIETGSKTSQHYVNLKENKLSNAVDVFFEGNPSYVFFRALYSKLWNGIGLYLDTKYNNEEWPMFHFDLRDFNAKGMVTIWVRKNHEYFYPQTMKNGELFLLSCLNELSEFNLRK